MTQENILILGASGQIGSELTMKLREMYGNDHVVATDLKEPAKEVLESGPFEVLNAMNEPRLREIVEEYNITQVYHLVAMLSATAEKNPELGWDLNMTTLFHVLNLAKEKKINRVFWPSSIAAFGPNTPMQNTPQYSVMDPTTVYGISKLAGELWCQYYHQKFGVDVRSIRYPGLISWKTEPGGGTTDYAIDIFYEALKNGEYTCFLSKDSYLPMMYMDDAIRATLELMHAPSEKVKIRTSYNLGGISFSPAALAEAIKKHLPDFKIEYAPDFRDAIAASWPDSIDDTDAQNHWGWKQAFDLDGMTKAMLENISAKLDMK